MPLSSYMGNFQDEEPSIKRTTIWRGINQTYDESKMAVDAKEGCYTPRSVNTWIEGGNITVRNNYVEVTPTTATADIADEYTYILRKLDCHASPVPGASKMLAIAEAQSGGVFHHYCLLERKMDLTDTWAVVKSASTHALGAATNDIWFQNPDMSFANYSGDFMEYGTTLLATMLTNGYDPQAFYKPGSGLHVLGYYGWKNVTANATLNVLTSSGLVSANDERVELYSRTQEMPGGLTPFTMYYAVNVSGSNFGVSLTSGGAPIDITSLGANVVGRLNKDFGGWQHVTVDTATSRFTLASVANAQFVVFAAPSGGTMPRGLIAGRYYAVVNKVGSTWQVAAKTDGDPITIKTAGNNVQVRSLNYYPNDAPRSKDITIHEDRPWAFKGDTLYYGAGFYDNEDTEAYDGMAHPNDWYMAVLAGNIPKPTWDGDTLIALRSLGGRLWAFKRNSLFEITGNKAPFGVRQVQQATGTIAPQSICEHPLYGIYWATQAGIVRFNGVNTEPFLVDVIKGMWSADNEDCILRAVGDMLIFHGNLNHPKTGVKGKALMAVDLATGNINYWTLGLNAIEATNLVINGGFATTENWDQKQNNYSTVTVSDGEITLTQTHGEDTQLGYGVWNTETNQWTDLPVIAGHKYYISAGLYSELPYVLIQLGASATVVTASHVAGDTEWHRVSAIGTCAKSEAASIYIRNNAFGSLKARRVIVIDLTDSYGAGNEPTDAATIDALLAANFATAWFDGDSTLNTRNGATSLTVECVLDPRYTTVDDGTKPQEFVFASNDGRIYKYSLTPPAAGEAVPHSYMEPQTAYGDGTRRKRIKHVKIDGEGGTLTVTPYSDGVAGTAKTFELPHPRPITISAYGYKIGLEYSSTNDPVKTKSAEREFA